MELKFNKDNWEKVTLGDVVFEPKETAKDISEEGLEHIVGLEHIESGDIHLRNSFSADTDTTFTKVFRNGDVLFGRRRAYLKKAAQATFDGICSGDITVLRANKKLDTRLLPFVIHNDKFFDYAIKHSAGGLSPRVKFKDLANYEFLLPPKNQQAELADLLWAMDDVIEKDLDIYNANEFFFQSSLKKFFNISEKCRLGDLCSVKSGDTAPQDSKYFDNGRYPFIRMQHINTNTKGYTNKFDYLNDSGINKMKLFPKNSILIPKSGESIRSENKVILDRDSYVVNHLAVLFNFKENILFKYVFYFFQNFKLSSLINQTSMPSLNLSEIANINIPMAEVNAQQKIVADLDHITNNKDILFNKIQSSKALQKSLINQIF
ncbi:restriction endonuclease subunit S [Elizabethkingia anophelis]|uniref:restriction endonuclease subunit S n=1 Tax=Elizabethkingia anophelis TaxID=1117645 RepID=UPI003786FCFC